jgi:hypothetical protein
MKPNYNIKATLQDAIREYNSTDFSDTGSVHYLVGYLKGAVENALHTIESVELEEKYRKQEESEFLDHLGK